MSAEVVSFPEPCYRPDTEALFTLIDQAEKSNSLLALAQAGLRAVDIHIQKGDDGPQACQGITNGLALAFFVTATMLGIPRGEARDWLPSEW
jgi:hypothetical protein